MKPVRLQACWRQSTRLKGPKEVLILVNSDHHGSHNAQAAYFSRSEEWARRLMKGDTGFK